MKAAAAKNGGARAAQACQTALCQWRRAWHSSSPKRQGVSLCQTPRRDTCRTPGLGQNPEACRAAAWSDVWICPSPAGHLQATGYDAKGRKQYRYHSRWRAVRDENKFDRMLAFAEALPRTRRRVQKDLRRRGLPREKVLATIVLLLETTLIRVGNEEYARHNHSYGLTTLRDPHARVSKKDILFEFRGKGGLRRRVTVHDGRLAQIVKRCRDLPGQELFQYVDAKGKRHSVGSADVNSYLQVIGGAEFSAKDFHTWAATLLAFRALAHAKGRSPASRRKSCLRCIQEVANELSNTPAICRKCYIHPQLVTDYLEGSLKISLKAGRKRDDRALLKWLRKATARLAA